MVKVTAQECYKKISEAKRKIKFARNNAEAHQYYEIACKYQSICSPSYCGSRPCELCHIEREYNEQLRKIAFAAAKR